ncbi:MAG TPA: FtsQ-type POTRA domain-containing protein [Kofleriaceae bacterium]|nr:FtsQ-type POTRA domain-containing protein [Kofleriaceae bacterium]
MVSANPRRAPTQAPPPAKRRRRNRRLGLPLRARVPSRAAIGRAVVRAGRAALPAVIAFAVAGGVGAGGYYGYHWLTRSERFAITEIEVRGAERLDPAHIRALIGVPEHATGAEANIFRLGLAEVEHRLQADPWIASAEVSRQLPSRLIVELREEHAAALVELDGLYLADAQGRVFKRAQVEVGEGLGLPIITGVPRKAYLTHPEVAREAIRTCLEALRVYQRDRARPVVAEVHFDARRGITFHSYDGAMAIRVGDGDAEQIDRRLDTFDVAWAALSDDERQGARVVYVDNATQPDRVTVGFGRTETN